MQLLMSALVGICKKQDIELPEELLKIDQDDESLHSSQVKKQSVITDENQVHIFGNESQIEKNLGSLNHSEINIRSNEPSAEKRTRSGQKRRTREERQQSLHGSLVKFSKDELPLQIHQANYKSIFNLSNQSSLAAFDASCNQQKHQNSIPEGSDFKYNTDTESIALRMEQINCFGIPEQAEQLEETSEQLQMKYERMIEDLQNEKDDNPLQDPNVVQQFEKELTFLKSQLAQFTQEEDQILKLIKIPVSQETSLNPSLDSQQNMIPNEKEPNPIQNLKQHLQSQSHSQNILDQILSLDKPVKDRLEQIEESEEESTMDLNKLSQNESRKSYGRVISYQKQNVKVQNQKTLQDTNKKVDDASAGYYSLKKKGSIGVSYQSVRKDDKKKEFKHIKSSQQFQSANKSHTQINQTQEKSKHFQKSPSQDFIVNSFHNENRETDSTPLRQRSDSGKQNKSQVIIMQMPQPNQLQCLPHPQENLQNIESDYGVVYNQNQETIQEKQQLQNIPIPYSLVKPEVPIQPLKSKRQKSIEKAEKILFEIASNDNKSKREYLDKIKAKRGIVNKSSNDISKESLILSQVEPNKCNLTQDDGQEDYVNVSAQNLEMEEIHEVQASFRNQVSSPKIIKDLSYQFPLQQTSNHHHTSSHQVQQRMDTQQSTQSLSSQAKNSDRSKNSLKQSRKSLGDKLTSMNSAVSILLKNTKQSINQVLLNRNHAKTLAQNKIQRSQESTQSLNQSQSNLKKQINPKSSAAITQKPKDKKVNKSQINTSYHHQGNSLSNFQPLPSTTPKELFSHGPNYIDPELLYFRQNQAVTMRREKIQKQKESESLKKMDAKNRKIEILKQSRNQRMSQIHIKRDGDVSDDCSRINNSHYGMSQLYASKDHTPVRKSNENFINQSLSSLKKASRNAMQIGINEPPSFSNINQVKTPISNNQSHSRTNLILNSAISQPRKSYAGIDKSAHKQRSSLFKQINQDDQSEDIQSMTQKDYQRNKSHQNLNLQKNFKQPAPSSSSISNKSTITPTNNSYSQGRKYTQLKKQHDIIKQKVQTTVQIISNSHQFQELSQSLIKLEQDKHNSHGINASMNSSREKINAVYKHRVNQSRSKSKSKSPISCMNKIREDEECYYEQQQDIVDIIIPQKQQKIIPTTPYNYYMQKTPTRSPINIKDKQVQKSLDLSQSRSYIEKSCKPCENCLRLQEKGLSTKFCLAHSSQANSQRKRNDQ